MAGSSQSGAPAVARRRGARVPAERVAAERVAAERGTAERVAAEGAAAAPPPGGRGAESGPRVDMRAQICAGLHPDDATPRYLQLAAAIRLLIQSSALKPGDAIAPERDLAQWTGFARITVRRAIEELLREGILTRRHGSGTYVTRRIEQPLSVLASFTEDMRLRGWRADSLWLGKEVTRPSPSEALALGIGPAELVLRLARVRTAEGEPLAIEIAAVPVAILSSPDEVDSSLYAALARRGARPTHGVQRIHAGLATPEEARRLLVEPGSAVLRIERRAFLANGKPVEFTVSTYRGDRYDFVATLSGTSAAALQPAED